MLSVGNPPGGGRRLDIVFVVLLALVWGVVLVPSIFRTRLESSPINAVRRFEHSMGILARARRYSGPGRWVMVPKGRPQRPIDRRRQRVMRRRRQAFVRLVTAAGATFILGIPSPLRFVWWAHLAVDLALVTYMYRLRQWKVQERDKIVHIGPVPAEPAMPLEPEEYVQSG